VPLGATDQNKHRQVLLAVRQLEATSPARHDREGAGRRVLTQAQHRLTSAEVEQITAEYHAGEALRSIAVRWGINRETARLALKRAGAATRKHGEIEPSALKEARQLQDEGWSLNRLGAKFGIDPKTMKKRLSGEPKMGADTHTTHAGRRD